MEFLKPTTSHPNPLVQKQKLYFKKNFFILFFLIMKVW